MNSQSPSQLGILTNKKQSTNTIQYQNQQSTNLQYKIQQDNVFLIKRQSSVLFRGKSQNLSNLAKSDKMKQMNTLFDHYNLFKYGKVITGSKIGKRNNSENKGQLNPQIKKYKNGQQAIKQSKQLKSRLSCLNIQRKDIFNKIKKYVVSDKK